MTCAGDPRPRTPMSPRPARSASALAVSLSLVLSLALSLVPAAARAAGAESSRGSTSARSAAAQRPRPDERRVIGVTREGRNIVAERYGNGPVVVFVGGSIHGNEKSGGRVIASIIDRRPAYTLWVIRLMNPDGYARSTRGNAAGVDLNRNFDANWRALPCPARNCAGQTPASEPETIALQSFFLETQPKLAVFYHSTNNGIDDSTRTSAVPAAVTIYSAKAGVPIRNFRCKGPCSGTATRYVTTNVAGSTAFVVELPYEDDAMPAGLVAKHRAGFWAAAREVRRNAPAPVG